MEKPFWSGKVSFVTSSKGIRQTTIYLNEAQSMLVASGNYF